MKKGDFYNHYREGKEYYFDCIALPVEPWMKIKPSSVNPHGVARYHEDTHDIELYVSGEGVTFIDSDVPHVIYQSEDDYNTEKVYAREVDDFFGWVNATCFSCQPRFMLREG